MISLLHLGDSKIRNEIWTVKLQQTCARNLSYLPPCDIQVDGDNCGQCILASDSDNCGHYILASASDSYGHCILAFASDNCGHSILASARKHMDALLCTNMRTVSGVSGSDSVFAEDSCLHWCGAVTLSECSPTFRPIFREYSTTQRRTQIRHESSSNYYKVTHCYVCRYVCMYIHIHIQLLTITLAS
jgi:hypothetical protein